jgi:hypothetical protein
MNANSDDRNRVIFTAVMALMLTGGLVRAADELPTYHVTLLDDMVEQVFPGIEYPNSHATSLNENGDLLGQVILNYDPVTGSAMQSFVYTVEHGVVALPLPPGWPSNWVADVSDRDANGEIIIVGGGVPGPYVDMWLGEAALWRFSTVTGEVLEVRTLGIPAGFDDSVAVAVSNDGTVVGFSHLTGPYVNWKYDIATDVLETFDFPARVKDLNNVGQVCGGVYRGDLFGNYEDLTDPYDPGDVMPEWAIENGGISAAWRQINDLGWLVGTAGVGYVPGGLWETAAVRYADPIGWTSMAPAWQAGGAAINDPGDFMDGAGAMYFEHTGEIVGLTSLISPQFPDVSVYKSRQINNNRQVAGHQAHVFLLTPLGEMIIPGDVNGDVSVDLDDYCAWVLDPIDLDGDGDVDEDDEQWLVERLEVFGYSVDDCNANGACDHCDIVDGLSLDCDLNDVPDECQDDCNGDGVPNVCEPDCNTNGTPDPCDIAAGTSEDCNDNGIPDECDLGGVTQVQVVHDPPIQMLVSDFIVDETLVVDAGIVEDVNLTLDINYRLGDFTVLLSHNDTTITIMDRPGYPEHYGGFVNFGYDNALVDDEGHGPYLENAGDYCCTFEPLVSPPSYRPNTPGSPQLSAFDGMPVEGIWSLTVITTDHSSPGDGIFGWGLSITQASVPVPPCCPADLDGDGTVGGADLGILLGSWSTAGPTDLDGNGTTDGADLGLLLAAWGNCP